LSCVDSKMEELAAFCGFDIERLTSMPRTSVGTQYVWHNQKHSNHICSSPSLCSKNNIQYEAGNPVPNRTRDDPNAAQTNMMPLRSRLSALTSITVPQYSLGMHRQMSVAYHTASLVTSHDILSPVSPSPLEQSNGHHQSRLNCDHQKIRTQHRHQMYRSTS
jgi:hypothetical protein